MIRLVDLGDKFDKCLESYQILKKRYLENSRG